MALSSGMEVKSSGVSYCLADTERISNREIRRPAASGVSLCSAISIEVTNHLGLEVVRSAIINSCSLHSRGQGGCIVRHMRYREADKWKKKRKSYSVSVSKHEDINFQGTCGKTPPKCDSSFLPGDPHPPLA